MRKSIGIFFASFLILAGFTLAVSAQERRGRLPMHNINQRQQNQDRRVYNGIQSGQLTEKEAARIDRQEDRIDRREARYRASGNGLSLRERYKLERSLNRESRGIYRQKHDGQTHPPTPTPVP